MDVRGIGLPGHFITALYHASGKIFIDPFDRGEVHTVDECLQIVRTHMGNAVAPDLSLVTADRQKNAIGPDVENVKLDLCPAK